MRAMACAALVFMTLGCSKSPDKLNGKLLCEYESQEAYVAVKNVGDTMFLYRNIHADDKCQKEAK